MTDVMLAGEDGDYGLVRASGALAHAQQLADEEGATITLRDPLTDEIIDTVEPDAEAPGCRWATSAVAPAPHSSEDDSPDGSPVAQSG